MLSDYFAKTDLSQKMRYDREEKEDESEWDDIEENVYDTPEDIINYQTDFQPQETGK